MRRLFAAVMAGWLVLAVAGGPAALAIPAPISHPKGPSTPSNDASCGTNSGILPNLYDHVSCGTDKQGGVGPQIKSVQDVLVIVANLVRILIAVAGALAIIVIVAASLYYITSAGDPGRVKRAKDILVNVSIGLMIITISYALMTYIAGFF